MQHQEHAALRNLFTHQTARRGLFAGLAAMLLAPTTAAAKKRRKRRRGGRPTPNAFGCLDVGSACRGNGDACCSGICLGKKPKRGKKDTSRCAEHNTGGCLLENDSCGFEVPDLPCDADGVCMRTTGNASF